MCYWKSGEVELVDGRAMVRTLDGVDSHTKIREAHRIPEAGAPGDQLTRPHTPVEFLPRRGCEQIEQYDLVFDAGRPDWMPEDMLGEIREQMFAAAQRDRELKTVGDVWVYAGGELSLPAAQSVGDVWVYAGGELSLPVAQSVGDVRVDAGGGVSLPVAQSVGRVWVNAGGELSLPAAQSVGDVDVCAGGSLSLPAAQSVGDVCVDAGGVLSLPVAQSVGDVRVYAGGVLRIPSACAVGNISGAGLVERL